MENLKFKIIASFMLGFLSPLATPHITAVAPQGYVDFTAVAKKSIPAVVSVKVRSSVKPHTQSPFGSDDPSDFFNDEFFQRFFGGRGRQRTPQPQTGQASGFLISSDGYILTNNHVVKSAGEITIQLNDGREFSGEVIGQDENTDVAVVKIEGTDLPHLELGNSSDLDVGQWVAAIGNPLGLQASVTVGVVSAKGRSNLDLANIEDFIQTDAAINRGNSGGPLLDLDGKVIGVNTAIVTNNGTGGYMGIGFAIPSNMARHVMEQLIDTGKVTRGFLGVTLQQIDHDLALAFGLQKVEGALVADIANDSPAQRGGLQQGDVIIRYNNKDVTTIASLRNAVSLLEPGTKISLSVLRGGNVIEIPIEIGTFPTDEGTIAGAENKLGVQVQELTPEVARNLGLIDEQGVVVSQVEPNSVAAMAGIKKGALIMAVNQQEVTNVEEFNQTVAQTEEGKPVLLLIKQGNYTRFLSLRVR